MIDRSLKWLPLLALPLTAQAQYPVIPDSVLRRAEAVEARWEAADAEAWAKALPLVLHDDSLSRPYRPWASLPEHLSSSAIPAFPGAEGGGAYTEGGRGGRVFVVTSLADSGPGTLREACEAGGARFVVFNVAGEIALSRPISIRAPYITIAGQTAPGDGVCVTGHSLHIDTHDVVLRYMRFRRGATDVAFRDDAIGGNAVGNIIIDHVSASWGLDEVMSIYRHVYDRDSTGHGLKLPTVNVTIQNSIFAEALDIYNHAFGATIGGLNSTFMRNLFASNISRNASIGMGGDFNFVNNVIYNWWNRTLDGGDHTSRLNIINNVFKPGPVTDTNKPGAPIRHRIIKLESGRDDAHRDTYGQAYVEGNIVWGNDSVTADNWKGGVQLGKGPLLESQQAGIRCQVPFAMAPLTLLPSRVTYEIVLSDVGANIPCSDAVDRRIIESVRRGEAIYAADAAPVESAYVQRRLPPDSYRYGIITHPSQVGGLPLYQGAPRVDSDGDGMPDQWEIANGLDPADPTDASLLRKDGYTNIEHWSFDCITSSH